MKSLTCFVLAALLAGCSKEGAPTASAGVPPAAGQTPASASVAASKETAKGEDCANCPDATAMGDAHSTTPDLAKGITLSEVTPISRILAAPADFEGKRLLVKGVAVDVCEKRGCWVTLKSEADNGKALRVKVEDGEIVFPLTLKGHEVEVEGVVEKLVTPEETYRELLRKRAESKGEAFDPTSVKGPLVTWQLRGLGARWEG
ncbi:MAG: DUF4920 domain-containing protein [Planctomycetota bacterium]